MRQQSLLSDEAGGPGLVERWAQAHSLHPVMGVDEAGRGCLAGPVVAAAVVLPDPPAIRGIDDSKTLAPSHRSALAAGIREAALAWGLGLADSAAIDRNGILPATMQAMSEAVGRAIEVLGRRPGIVVVDGNQTIPGLVLPQKAWPKGDHLSLNCAAASILAKVARDEMMEGMEGEHPGYGFGIHKGYGTARHLEAIRRLGPCAIHRMSFAPLRDLLTSRPR